MRIASHALFLVQSLKLQSNSSVFDHTRVPRNALKVYMFVAVKGKTRGFISLSIVLFVNNKLSLFSFFAFSVYAGLN